MSAFHWGIVAIALGLTGTSPALSRTWNILNDRDFLRQMAGGSHTQ